LTFCALAADLERVIRLILLYPRGLSILLGAAPPPSALELISAFPARTYDSMGIHSSQRPYEEQVTELSCWMDETVRQAGGWGHIVSAVSQWRDENSEDWNLMAAHISWFGPGRKWANRAKLKKLAAGYRCSERTITRKRKHFPGVLADYILFVCP
jgi:hypothetical protein